MIWYKDTSDIVISTRVRLARNIDGIAFPHNLKNKEEITQKIRDAVFKSNSTLSRDFKDAELGKMSLQERRKISEKHLISDMMVNGGDCLINSDETMSIMIMEEDHLRQQVILGGYKLDEAYEICDRVDDVLSENLNFAFDENIGYLTACPTNVGTGMRASVMLHLPGLCYTNRMERIIQSANNVGITVRGYYGEGSKAEGCFFQISNQITTGASEKEIIERVKNVTDQIIGFEKEARAYLMNNKKTEIEDKVYRSYGILKFSRSISSREAIGLLSDVLLGKNMGIITEDGNVSVMECIVNSAPAHVGGGDIPPEKRDALRAEYLRNNV